MARHQRSVLVGCYLGVAVLGWVFFGIVLRAVIDGSIAQSQLVSSIVFLAILGLVLLLGAPWGYSVIRGSTTRRRSPGH